LLLRGLRIPSYLCCIKFQAPKVTAFLVATLAVWICALFILYCVFSSTVSFQRFLLNGFFFQPIQKVMNKLTVFLVLLLLTALNSFGQGTGNSIVFSEDGQPFFLIINGVQQNDQPQTNVKLTALPEAIYAAKVIFADQRLGEIKKNMFGVQGGQETTYKIKRKKTGEYDMGLFSQVPLPMQQIAAPNQAVITYHATPNVVIVPAPIGTPVLGTTVTTSTTTQGGENVNVGMNVAGAGMGVNANENGVNFGMGGTDPNGNPVGFNMGVNVNPNTGNVNINMGGTTTTTTSRTYSQSGVYTPDVITTQPQPTAMYYQMQGYGGIIGCPWPMNDGAFAQAAASIGNQDFEQNKLQVAKQIVGSNCLTSAQVRKVMDVFDFEQSKLDFAKFCYGHTYDVQNYFVVNDAFDFSTSVTDLNNYIAANPVTPYPQQVVVYGQPNVIPAPLPRDPRIGQPVPVATGGCAYPMQAGDFAAAKNSIGNQSFEQNKLQVAKQVFGTNCLTSAQVKEIMGLFDFEQSKLDFAKFAYGHTYDPQNFYILNDAFDFSNSVTELNKFIGR